MRLLVFILLSMILLKVDAQINEDIILRDEIRVSSDLNGGELKCEPSVIIDKNVVVVSWNDSYGGQSGTGYGVCVAWSISYDHGKTFEFGGYLSENQKGVFGGADSWLAKDSKGNFYLQVLSFKEAIHLYYMDRSNLGKWIRLSNPVNSSTADKPFLHIQDNDVFWISYSDDQKIFIIFSKDYGQIWSRPLLVSNGTKKSRGGSSITTYEEMVFVTWTESTDNELWYTIIQPELSQTPQLLYEQPDSKGIMTLGYSMGFDHGETSGKVATPNLTWLNNSKNDTHPVNLTFGVKEKEMSSILLFEYNLSNKSWEQPRKVGEVQSSYSRIFASNSNIGKYPAILYYDRRACKSEECAITDIYLSVLNDEKWSDFKINTESTDWQFVPGDEKYAPIQRNFGDYITLASDGDKLIAVWTDGRKGNTQIYSRIIELLHTKTNKRH